MVGYFGSTSGLPPVCRCSNRAPDSAGFIHLDGANSLAGISENTNLQRPTSCSSLEEFNSEGVKVQDESFWPSFI